MNSTTHRAREPDRRSIRAAEVALGWVLLFLGFHIYWYLGGSFASPGELPGEPRTLFGWISEVVVDGGWALGLVVPFALSRGWVGGRLATPAAIVVWLGAVLLVLRGGAGLVDDATRVTGLLPTGLTGLSTKQTTGMAHVVWSGWAIDSYFLIGGVVFSWLAIRQRQGGRTAIEVGL